MAGPRDCSFVGHNGAIARLLFALACKPVNRADLLFVGNLLFTRSGCCPGVFRGSAGTVDKRENLPRDKFRKSIRFAERREAGEEDGALTAIPG